MWASSFEVNLYALKGKGVPTGSAQISRNAALVNLISITGEDFGLDWHAWEVWGILNERFLNPPWFTKCLMNLKGLLPETSLYYLPVADAIQQLILFSDQNYGDSVELWEEWGRAQGLLPSQPADRSAQK